MSPQCHDNDNVSSWPRFVNKVSALGELRCLAFLRQSHSQTIAFRSGHEPGNRGRSIANILNSLGPCLHAHWKCIVCTAWYPERHGVQFRYWKIGRKKHEMQHAGYGACDQQQQCRNLLLMRMPVRIKLRICSSCRTAQCNVPRRSKIIVDLAEVTPSDSSMRASTMAHR